MLEKFQYSRSQTTEGYVKNYHYFHKAFFFFICLPYTQFFFDFSTHRDTRMPLSYMVVGVRCIHMSVIIYSPMNATSKHLSHMHFIQQQNNSYWHECAASTTSRHNDHLRKIAIAMGNLVDNYNFKLKSKTIKMFVLLFLYLWKQCHLSKIYFY